VLVHLLGMGYWKGPEIDLTAVNRLVDIFDDIGVGPSAKYPLFGRDAYVTRAGIHADGLSKFWWMYAPFNAPALVGRELEVALTKDSGQAGLLFLLRRRLGQQYSKDDPRVTQVNRWLEEQFDAGRVAPVEWPELASIVAAAFGEPTSEVRA
jgi:2-phosphinomethylmalic acid synthase